MRPIHCPSPFGRLGVRSSGGRARGIPRGPDRDRPVPVPAGWRNEKLLLKSLVDLGQRFENLHVDQIPLGRLAVLPCFLGGYPGHAGAPRKVRFSAPESRRLPQPPADDHSPFAEVEVGQRAIEVKVFKVPKQVGAAGVPTAVVVSSAATIILVVRIRSCRPAPVLSGGLLLVGFFAWLALSCPGRGCPLG